MEYLILLLSGVKVCFLLSFQTLSIYLCSRKQFLQHFQSSIGVFDFTNLLSLLRFSVV